MSQATIGLPQRGEIQPEHTWDASSIFPNDAAWESELATLADSFPGLEAFQGHLGDGSATLADWFARSEDAGLRLYRAYIYASLFHEANTGDQEAKAKVDRVLGLFARGAAAMSFAEPEMLALGFATLRRWVAEEPRLALYAHAIDRLERRQEHVRSAEVEELLGMALDPFSSAEATHGILADADLTFRPALDSQGEASTIAQGTIDALLARPDRTLRRNAWEGFADAHLALKNTMASCLATGVKQHVFTARARRYPSSLEASLSASFVPTEVYYNLIATFKEHLPVWHRYWDVRRRALGQDDIAPYDIWAPLTANPPRVTFDQAVEWIAAGLAPLGEEYVSLLRQGVNEQRWVDKYPNVGKRAGAFSTGCQGTHPFILMNGTDDLESLSTLAHELGHSLHSLYTWRAQPPVYADYSIFLAEVASNFNQALVRAYLFEQHPDRDFQLALINEAMSNFHRYFFLMPTLARFELELHERVERGEALTADTMNALLTDLFREAYGPGVTIDADRVGITWAQFSTHLYGNFYVFQYATGLSGAHALAEGILAGEPGAVERYLAFLRAGNSAYPLDVLKRAGVDLTTPAPVRQTFGVLTRLVDRLESLVGA
jgi:oligoendopeptidase F